MEQTGDRYRVFDTPAGPFALIEGATGLSATWLDGTDGETGLSPHATEDPGLLPALSERLARYFKGEEVEFADVPTPPGPAFQRRCWEACRAIPHGRTTTYAQLAAQAGSPGAARAAGQAMRHNPLPVIVPCHRVLGAGGRLHGYGGSLDPEGRPLAIKRSLLALEANDSALGAVPVALPNRSTQLI